MFSFFNFKIDYLSKIDSIISELRGPFPELAEEIHKTKSSSFTSSELLMNVTHELIQVTTNNKAVKELIGKEVLQLKKYCKSLGLLVK